jgi:hypothetical protein
MADTDELLRKLRTWEIPSHKSWATQPRNPDGEEAAAAIEADAARIAELEAENADLKLSVIAFAGPWADRHAREFDLPPNHLHPTHYDLLAKCGARMNDFVRATLKGADHDAG